MNEIVYDELGMPIHAGCGGSVYQSCVDSTWVCMGCGRTVCDEENSGSVRNDISDDGELLAPAPADIYFG